MAKEEGFAVEGKIIGQERNYFIVQCEHADVKATIGGPIVKRKLRLVIGDSVQVEISPYDMDRGRIVRRNH